MCGINAARMDQNGETTYHTIGSRLKTDYCYSDYCRWGTSEYVLILAGDWGWETYVGVYCHFNWYDVDEHNIGTRLFHQD